MPAPAASQGDDRPVRWGLLSTSRIGTVVLAAGRASSKLDFVAVASRDRDRADAYAREHSIARAYGGYEELLRDPEVEAVYIGLPNALHVEWCIRALAAGKHVLCEKPLSRSSSGVERSFAAAAKAGRLLCEAFMYQHHPQTRRVAELVRSGAIGRLVFVHGTLTQRLPDPDTDIRTEAALDGGALMDLGTYCVSYARLLAGEPVRVFGERTAEPSEVDVAFSGALVFESGVTAHFESGMIMPRRDVLEVIGTEGTLEVDDPFNCRTPAVTIRRDWSADRVRIEPADSYRLELEDLSDGIRGGRAPLLGRDDAIGQARTLEALQRSAATHAVVTLDASTEGT